MKTWAYIAEMSLDELRSFLTAWGAFCKSIPLYVELPNGDTVRIA